MVEWLGDWIRQIVILILVATFLDLMLPSGAMDRYVKLVMGLLIILAILSPVFRLLDRELDPAALGLEPSGSPPMKPLDRISSESRRLEDAASLQVRQEAEKKLEKSLAEEVGREFGVEVVKTDVTVAESGDRMLAVRGVELVVRPREPSASGRPETIRPVEPVAVTLDENGTRSGETSAMGAETEQTRQIAKWVASWLQLPQRQVRVAAGPAF